MDHIRQYDWCQQDQESQFVKELELDNCVTNRILRNTFHDPLLSSDSEDEQQKIDWNTVFRRKNQVERQHKVFVPLLNPIPKYPKLSSLTYQQHFHCLKVICNENLHVLPQHYIPRPTKTDYKVYEEVKETYIKEQKEFIEWAKSLWVSTHCIRALRPKPPLERTYEAEYKMKAMEMQSFPKNYEMAALISLLNPKDNCTMTHVQDIIHVDVNNLPQIEYPDPLTKKFVIMKPCPVPEPCDKHQCWFVLPKEKDMSILPLTEVHRELALFALDNDAQYIASESALKCLVERERYWTLPISVCDIINADGDKRNVIVFGSEFSSQRKSAMLRTYRAYRHHLQYALIPPEEKNKINNRRESPERDLHLEGLSSFMNDIDVSSDEDEGLLCIDEDFTRSSDRESENEKRIPAAKKVKEKSTMKTRKSSETRSSIETRNSTTRRKQKQNSTDEFYNCTCKESSFGQPPPRSFRKWRIKNKGSGEQLNLIVHCSHKMRSKNCEVIAEPIPEYQLDLGASKQPEDKIRSLALSLMLRKNASLLNVRVEATSGEVVTIESIQQEELARNHPSHIKEVANILFESLSQLQGLMPGHYVLQHEPGHGENAFLFAPIIKGRGQTLDLDFSWSVATETDDAKDVKTVPQLVPTLLPYHKFRRILPCAFTTNESQLMKEPKKPPSKQKTPPQALKWPKKRGRKKKKKNN